MLAAVRADRLVATLLLLQTRGRVTAAEVAAELEVSERTARRDLEALSMAGIPVYSQAGRGGGWSLIGGARTDLSGLTAAEARTLFLIAGPSSAATPEAKSALRKLVRALPETFRAEAEAAAAAVMIDSSRWGGDRIEPPRFLDDLQQAVVSGCRVVLGYTNREQGESTRTVSPLGLVQKGLTWYLLANTDDGIRTFRVQRVRSLVVTDDPADRPEGFDLAAAWQEVLDAMDEQRPTATVRALADPPMLQILRMHWGSDLTVHELVDPSGRVSVTVTGRSVGSIAEQLAAYGGMVEVVDPPEARHILARVGASLVATYGPPPD
jgi:predicted DNA-binding transcriptional regulator YafY